MKIPKEAAFWQRVKTDAAYEHLWYTYILRCEDGSLYIGITTDLPRRFREHASGTKKGAKYTRRHPPVRFEAAWQSETRAEASRLEYRLKRLTKAEKEALIAGSLPEKPDMTGYVRTEIPEAKA